MGIITIGKIKPEMLLAEDLRDRNGRFLLGKGTRLTPKHLRILKIWGVIEASIDGLSEDELEENDPSPMDPALLDTAEAFVRPRFCYSDLDLPANRELYRQCILRKADELSKKRPSQKPVKLSSSCRMEFEVEEATDRGTVAINPLDLIGDDIALSTLPILLAQINEAISRPNSSAKDFADIVGKDTSLSARLLKIVNSAFFGYPSRIDSLSRAVLIVGTRQLCSLAMGIKILSVFKSIPCELIDMKSFIEHSVVCGILARILAGYKNVQNVERLFVGGLLHDIGRLVLFNHLPNETRIALLKAKHTKSLLYEMERETMGCDHSRLGGVLLKKWRLPISLENMVRYHHAPLKSKDPLEPALVYFADLIAIAVGIGSSGEQIVPPLNPLVWKTLGLSVNILPLVLKQMESQFEEVCRFLLCDEC